MGFFESVIFKPCLSGILPEEVRETRAHAPSKIHHLIYHMQYIFQRKSTYFLMRLSGRTRLVPLFMRTASSKFRRKSLNGSGLISVCNFRAFSGKSLTKDLGKFMQYRIYVAVKILASCFFDSGALYNG